MNAYFNFIHFQSNTQTIPHLMNLLNIRPLHSRNRKKERPNIIIETMHFEIFQLCPLYLASFVLRFRNGLSMNLCCLVRIDLFVINKRCDFNRKIYILCQLRRICTVFEWGDEIKSNRLDDFVFLFLLFPIENLVSVSKGTNGYKFNIEIV